MTSFSTLQNLTTLLGRESGDEEVVVALLALKNAVSHSPKDIANLALLLARSGDQFPECGASIADVASTGGPTSLSTLLTPLFLRSAGMKVAKLGVPGRPAGGIDVLAQIAGFSPRISMAHAARILDESGYVHFLAEGDAAPLDGKLFQLRQHSGTQEVAALVVASILAKKLAVRATHVGLDIRVSPHGNFGSNWNIASANAILFSETAKLLEITPAPILTDGRYPYQPYLGRSESLLALFEIFSESADDWLIEHFRLCRTLAQACLPYEQRANLSKVSRKCLESNFSEHVLAQGGETSAFYDLVERTKRSHDCEIISLRDGYVEYPLLRLRSIFSKWQKLFANSNVPFPDPIGMIFRFRPGEWVSKGTVLATFRADESIRKDVCSDLCEIIANPPSVPRGPTFELIYE